MIDIFQRLAGLQQKANESLKNSTNEPYDLPQIQSEIELNFLLLIKALQDEIFLKRLEWTEDPEVFELPSRERKAFAQDVILLESLCKAFESYTNGFEYTPIEETQETDQTN